MKTVRDAQDVVGETLAWLLHGGTREVAAWAADAGWVLVACDLLPREVWKRECDEAAARRGQAFRNPWASESDNHDGLSSPYL